MTANLTLTDLLSVSRMSPMSQGEQPGPWQLVLVVSAGQASHCCYGNPSSQEATVLSTSPTSPSFSDLQLQWEHPKTLCLFPAGSPEL